MQQKTAVRQRRRGGRKKIILITIAAFLALCIGASAIYLNIHYSAGEAAMQAMQGGDGVTVSERQAVSTAFCSSFRSAWRCST